VLHKLAARNRASSSPVPAATDCSEASFVDYAAIVGELARRSTMTPGRCRCHPLPSSEAPSSRVRYGLAGKVLFSPGGHGVQHDPEPFTSRGEAVLHVRWDLRVRGAGDQPGADESLQLEDRVLGLIPGSPARNSVKRFGPVSSSRTMSVAQVPSSTVRNRAIGHSGRRCSCP
jgi:hypothetical protein